MKFIIIGAGNVGLSLARMLTRSHHVVLIELNEAIDLPADMDVQFIHANGCSPQVLVEAGVNTADYLIAVAQVDETNISACLMAKLINPTIKRIARIRNLDINHPEITKEHLPEYFDHIINPDSAGADYLLRTLQVPGAREVEVFGDGRLQMFSFEIAAGSPFDGKSLIEIRAKCSKTPFIVVAIIRDDSVLTPVGSDKIRAGDIIYCISKSDYSTRVMELAGQTIRTLKHAMVWAGSNLATRIAHSLTAQGVGVKLILSEEDVVTDVLDDFQDCLVLRGSGTDTSLLQEEQIADVDLFIAASPSEEDNILAALLAKKLQAKLVIAQINNLKYNVLVSSVGVDMVVNTYSAAASSIVRHIHQESVTSEFSLRLHENAREGNFIELHIKENNPLVGIPFKDISFPRGMIIGAIARQEEVLLPNGDTKLSADDYAVIFVKKDTVRKLEKLFNVKLELLE